MIGGKHSFFFQAEDGIRDGTVTGVQTCALPICFTGAGIWELPKYRGESKLARGALNRSEERRVGKECRSRRSPCRQKKNKSERSEAEVGEIDGSEGVGWAVAACVCRIAKRAYSTGSHRQIRG